MKVSVGCQTNHQETIDPTLAILKIVTEMKEEFENFKSNITAQLETIASRSLEVVEIDPALFSGSIKPMPMPTTSIPTTPMPTPTPARMAESTGSIFGQMSLAVDNATSTMQSKAPKDPSVEFGFQLILNLFEKEEIATQTIQGKRKHDKLDEEKMGLVKQQIIQKFDCENNIKEILRQISQKLKNYKRKLK